MAQPHRPAFWILLCAWTITSMALAWVSWLILGYLQPR